ncbi:hypothetical protein J9978_04395 [Chromobacterium violaceum]|nr:hypothetical protein [Chromobacterium violaceum]MBA8736845.1 hypothetical protein [Chromobacterium violaceum]MBP4046567.1 hypothetical protein [Chromobacterium violaceum]MBP4048735.1 hypothetical protein [Chromobacterium violaceum]QIY80822.1 hypothetical protein FOB43_17320 [Chromobacterium violaceum]
MAGIENDYIFAVNRTELVKIKLVAQFGKLWRFCACQRGARWCSIAFFN